jgi:hypothetical protein
MRLECEKEAASLEAAKITAIQSSTGSQDLRAVCV